MGRAACSVHEQGTPVQRRDGPAAVNCRKLRFASRRLLPKPLFTDCEREGSERATAMSQKTYREIDDDRALSDWGSRCDGEAARNSCSRRL